MNRTERRRSRPECRFDKLESRELLNAHVPHHNSVHVSQLQAGVPRVIVGTVNGTYTSSTDPSNPFTGTETYSASGGTSAGPAAESGTQQWNYANINSNKYRENYFNVNETLTFNNGAQIAVSYTGSAVFSNATTGRYSFTVKGSAVGISGAYFGKTYSFVDRISGPNASYAFTEKITLSS